MDTILFFLQLFTAFCAVALFFMYLSRLKKCVALEHEVERLTETYRELNTQSSMREAALLDELIAERNSANLLAPIVEGYVSIIENTAALLQDDTPPSLANEKQALLLYHERKANRKDVGPKA